MERQMPTVFQQFIAEGLINQADILSTTDGFFMVYQSLSDILLVKDIRDFLDSEGDRLACDRFFDDWFLYAVPENEAYTYSLVKLREQEHDMEEEEPADGDTPGVTVSFISFDCKVLTDCLADPSDENRSKLNREINRVVAYRGQRHHQALKRYFKDPRSQGAYLVADRYTKHISTFAVDGRLEAPEYYREIVQQSNSNKRSQKLTRLPRFVESMNQAAGRVICDNEYIYIETPGEPTEYEAAVILATHAGNTSVYSFAAEVEYHARYLFSLARIKIPFFGKSIYDSAIRADMTVGDTEFEGPAPFYQSDSKIVRRQYALHSQNKLEEPV